VRPVRIAVIDSGVQASHPHINAVRILSGVRILPDGTIDDSADAATDRLGHGTAVAAAIQEKAPDALCTPVRVFGDALRTSSTALVAAIDWAAQGHDLINLSLGTTNDAHRTAFVAAVARAASRGCTIVAAASAQGVPCLPGSLPDVIGVELDWDCPRHEYRWTGGAFAASGYPRPIPGVPQQRNLYGISFAVAQMTGFAARALAGSATVTAAELSALLRQDQAVAA
jgi:subtilisin family serine protease